LSSSAWRSWHGCFWIDRHPAASWLGTKFRITSVAMQMKLMKIVVPFLLFFIFCGCHTPPRGPDGRYPKVGDKLVTLRPIYASPLKRYRADNAGPEGRSTSSHQYNGAGPNCQTCRPWTQIPVGTEILLTERRYLPGRLMETPPSYGLSGKIVGDGFPEIKESLGIDGLYYSGFFKTVKEFPSDITSNETRR